MVGGFDRSPVVHYPGYTINTSGIHLPTTCEFSGYMYVDCLCGTVEVTLSCVVLLAEAIKM